MTVENGLLRVTTHGLDDPRFARESLIDTPTHSRGVVIPALRNAWVAGTPDDRAFMVPLGNMPSPATFRKDAR